MNDQGEEIERLLERAMEQPPAQRRAWLQGHCSDPRLLAEAVALLQACEQAGDFMVRPLQIDCAPHLESSLIGRQLGPYRVDALLSHGGMGRIYRAHRNDGEYQTQVAVKLIESGHIDTSLLKHERQILADLHHPNIVSLLDGGTLEEGVPYLVMEQIQGVPVHHYVRQAGLNRRQIVVLFCGLARIVGLTHQHGVIHCDLKPDNVLVTREGELKLLDFGVAHLYAAGEYAWARRGDPLTLEYASPQRRSGLLPCRADDIYSLGVLLSVMLTGRPPMGCSGAASPDHGRGVACLDAELGALVRRATHPDPEARYPSVEALNQELQRWLDRLPLLALSDTPGYRLGKWLQRRCWPLLSALALGAVMGLGGVMWKLQHARLGQAQSMAVTQVEATLRDLDDRIERLQGSTPTRVAAVEETLEKLQRLPPEQGERPHIQRVLADAHLKLGTLLGHPFQLHLGQFRRSRAHLEQALATYRRLFLDAPGDFAIAMRLAKAQRIIVAQQVFVEGQRSGPLQELLDTLAWLRQIPRNSLYQDGQLAIQYMAVAHLQMILGRLEQAAGGLRQAALLLQGRAESGDAYEQEHNRRIYDFFLDERAIHAFLSGDTVRAEAAYRELLARYRDSGFWRDRRRSSRAHHALACIGILGDGTLAAAALHLTRARDILQSLSRAYPSAAPLDWELARYAGLDHLSRSDRRAWVEAFGCDRPQGIVNPPLPAWSRGDEKT